MGVIRVEGCVCGDLNAALVDSGVAAPAPVDTRPAEVVHHSRRDGNTAAIAITAFGTPGPQGSKSFKGSRATKNGGRAPILVESSKKVKPWREAVTEAATIALCQLTPAERLRYPLSGPLRAEMVFTLKRPARIPAERFVDGVPYPAAYPDSSKLVRSTEDALTGILWHDDALVVRYTLVEKLYLGTPGALDWTGAVIRLWPLGGVS